MKHGKSLKQPNSALADNKTPAASRARVFAGTSNPRHLRVIRSLLVRPQEREEIDRIAGASNGPNLITALRACGLRAACVKTPGIDRDGRAIKYGVYHLDDNDRHILNVWLYQRKVGGKA